MARDEQSQVNGLESWLFAKIIEENFTKLKKDIP